MLVRITFTKLPSGGIAWEAVRGDHTKVSLRTDSPQGNLPHDLAHYAVEDALEMQWGFWGCIAAGGSLRITTATHRKGHGKRGGRGLLRQHSSELAAAEGAIGRALAARQRHEKLATTRALEQIERQWQALTPGGTLAVSWPSTDRR